MTREEAIHDIEECVLPCVGGISLRMAIEDMKEMDRLSKAVPVLVEPVIYCKDCKYYKTPDKYSYAEPNLYCCRSALMKMSENDFCSKGERKEGEEK